MKKFLCGLGKFITGMICFLCMLLNLLLIVSGLVRDPAVFKESWFLLYILSSLVIQIVMIVIFNLLKKKLILFKGGPKAEELLKKKEEKELLKNQKKSEKDQAKAEKKDRDSEEYIKAQNESYEKYKVKQDALIAQKKEEDAKRQAVIDSEKAPSGEKVKEIYRLTKEGPEKELGSGLIALGFIAFILTAIISAKCMGWEPGTGSTIVKLLAVTVLAWALLIGFGLWGSYLKAIYREALLKVFVESESGEYYYCEILPRYEKSSMSANKILRTVKNAKIYERNEATTVARKYVESEEFSENVKALVEGKKENIPYNFKFAHLPNVALFKAGKFADTISYTQVGEQQKLRVHKNFNLKIK